MFISVGSVMFVVSSNASAVTHRGCLDFSLGRKEGCFKEGNSYSTHLLFPTVAYDDGDDLDI